MEQHEVKRRRIVLPVSRIILILVVGGVFLFRGIAAAIEKTDSNGQIAIYIIIGLILVVTAVVAILLRLRMGQS
ncbi:MAG: hypothetical protein AB1489_03985 [Acidobacteriota bacterium]